MDLDYAIQRYVRDYLQKDLDRLIRARPCQYLVIRNTGKEHGIFEALRLSRIGYHQDIRAHRRAGSSRTLYCTQELDCLRQR